MRFLLVKKTRTIKSQGEVVGTEDIIHWYGEGPDDVLYHGMGPSHTCRMPGDEILDVVEAEHADDLDWTRTTLWQKWDKRVDDTSLQGGWVSPEGRWYRCKGWQHDSLICDYLFMRVRDVEKGGWARIHHQEDGSHLIVVRNSRGDYGGRLTMEQTQTLLDGGVEIPDHMLDAAEGDWSAYMKRKD